MPTNALIPQTPDGDLVTGSRFEALIQIVLDAVDSPRTKRTYAAALSEFFDWYEVQGRPALTKATVQAYRTTLMERGLAPSTINVKLAAIRKLVSEAADNGALDQVHANGIKAVKGVKSEGVRAGNWLTKDQAQALLNAPDSTTLKGLRDRAILAVLLLAGLRRQEAADLKFDHLQMRENRPVIVDMVGKRGKVRSVPVKPVVKTVIDEWAQAAGIAEGYVFRPMRKGDHIALDYEARISDQAVWRVVEKYAAELGLENIAPHDLRRTYAKLAHKGGAAIEQISLNLGHANIQTTEKYLGVDLDLQNAPSDYIDLTVE
jgi:site-specific recombinase XerD